MTTCLVAFACFVVNHKGHQDQRPFTSTPVIPAKAAIGFTHLWPAMSGRGSAPTPLAREAGRGRGPLRSNGRVRGVPVTSFFAAPRSHTPGTFTRRPLVQLSAAPRDRAPLTLPTLTRWAPPSPRCRGARCIGDRRTRRQRYVHAIAALAGMTGNSVLETEHLP